MESAQTSPASLHGNAATQARWMRAAPTRPACDTRAQQEVLEEALEGGSFSVNHAAGDRSIAVDAAVAQKRPVAANFFQVLQVHFTEKNFLLVVQCLSQYAAEGIAEKRSAPEFKALARCGVPTNVARFKADAINDAHINAVGNRMRALNRPPGIMLRHAKLGLLRWMPSDSGRVKQNARTLQSRQPRTFRIPLVPANQRSDSSRVRIESLEAEIARSEVKLLVVERVVGDVHLAINSAQSTVGIKDRGRIVVDTRCALLEERRHQNNFVSPRRSRQFLSCGPGNWFGQVKQIGVLALAEILRLEKFRQADDMRALPSRLRHAINRLRHVVGW